MTIQKEQNRNPQAIAGLALAVLLSLTSPALACESEPQTLHPEFRPTCQPQELQSNMCINPNMQEAVAYMDSEAYKAVFNSVVASAMAYLDTLEPSKSKVVLFDLDETIVDNREYYLRNGGFNQKTWNAWVAGNGVGKVYPSVLNLMKTAQERGFSVMFITGRPASITKETLDQIPGVQWNGAFLKPTGIHVSSTVFKTEIREALREMGYEVVMNVGDQPSDMDLPVEPEKGEFLLPNVMYSIP